MLKLDRPVIVEGKYDRLRLLNLLDAPILTTDGFRIFRNAEKRLLFQRLAEKNGLFVLTDPDGGGLLIRNLLRGIISPDKIIHLYVPSVKGREHRKKASSKEGLLGVEGIDDETLMDLFRPFAVGRSNRQTVPSSVSKTDFFEDGLSGKPDSSLLRRLLAEQLRLPVNLSSNALLEAINLLYSKEEYREALRRIETPGQNSGGQK
ncbi:MAG: DUF4093 domain-containing protein [Clostridia bacterium]|nr:DUF4093 domain-containing protein [Clostridia bacterium]